MTMLVPSTTSDQIAERLLHVGRVSRSENAESGLTAAQWTCLRFFARANRSTRTPSAFADFQATTRGTASQIVKTLERRGLISRQKSQTDGRSVFFDLTDIGRAVLAGDPLGDLIAALDDLGSAEREALMAALSRVSSYLAKRKDAPAFGTCSDCTYFSRTDGRGYCACMSAYLVEADLDKLCASYGAG